MSTNPLIRHVGPVLHPDATRVAIRPFTPAENGNGTGPAKRPRAERLIDRVLSLSEDELERELDHARAKLSDSHHDVESVLLGRFDDLGEAVLAGKHPTHEQKLAIGACFVEEYSFESSALFNPSVVAHPDQGRLDDGEVRLVFSLRGVGEGHLSSISFRTGVFGPGGSLRFDEAARYPVSPAIECIPGGEPDDPGARLHFGAQGQLSKVVIFPVTYRQRAGLEDLRLVEFTEEDGRTAYYGTYTAFSGHGIRQELLHTADFATFELRPLQGPLCETKGMALFPRRVGGKYAMLGRHDHENIWLLFSDDLHWWDSGEIVVEPKYPWEFIQLGNCGSPLEIDEGWLVITHGVGPVRTYCLGACLLDKRDPARLLARTTEPLLRPSADEAQGYVPNVAYSCGAIARGRTMLLPYAVADTYTAFATVDIDALLESME
jgi:predicted GH43/DUF377 family glycosyl hydrolase